MAALFHFHVNGPAWPDAQPWDSVIFAVLAVVIVWINREHCFNKSAGAIDVLAPQGIAHATHLKRT